MTARCIQCNKRHNFRNQRGSKLSDSKCECGGKKEIIGGNHIIEGENPFEPQKTHTGFFGERAGQKYYYVEKNRKGELFYSHSDGYCKPVKIEKQ